MGKYDHTNKPLRPGMKEKYQQPKEKNLGIAKMSKKEKIFMLIEKSKDKASKKEV